MSSMFGALNNMRSRHDKNSQLGHFWECRHEFAHDPTRGSSRRRDDFSRRLKLEDETSRDQVSLSNVD